MKTGTTVTSVGNGNSWVICRSKSHPGHIYYFNTFSGESVWNLSEAEVKKAKARSQDKRQSGFYPEPKEPPGPPVAKMPYQFNNSQQETQTDAPPPAPPNASRVYNKQIINNQFPEHPFSFPAFIAPQCPVIPPTVPVPTSSYNPNIWAVPPTHQIFIAPNPSPFTKQSLHVPYNNQEPNITVQNTKIPLSKRFHNSNDSQTSLRWYPKNHTFASRYVKRNNENNKSFRYNKFSKQYPAACNSTFDLRSVLTRNRSKDHVKIEDNDEYDQQVQDNQSTYINKPSGRIQNTRRESKEDCGSDVDSDWLEDNIRVHGSKLELDISSLKSLADPNLNEKPWYIAVDMDILLGHLNFLNILFNSDEDCNLMVPRNILAILREQAEDTKSGFGNARRARRAIAFLTQHLDAGTAVIGEPSSDDINCDYPYLLDCCYNLLDQNSFVVLLSNDEELEIFKKTTDIPIFNIKQLRQFLESNCVEKTSSENQIEIVIPNDLAASTEKNVDPQPSTEKNLDPKPSTDSNCESNENHTPDYQTIDTVERVQAPVVPAKSTVDAEVQTEIVSVEVNQSANIAKEQNLQSKQHETMQTDNFTGSNIKNTNITSTKKIRLKRNTSNTTPTSNNDKRQFRWRRKRSKSCSQMNDSSNDIPTTSSNNNRTNNTQTNSISEYNNTIANDVNYSLITLVNGCEEDSETNSTITIPRTSINEIVIEESSTSGIISNSASNGESEIGSDKKQNNATSGEEFPRGIIYEVTDLTMEEHLATRCDEWISRFVQIMEEVLTQVLQRDTEFMPTFMPPPWTVQEATECIKIKFNNDDYIRDAATKLYDILCRVSDDKGSFSRELPPSEYMNMYSFGLYLVNCLKLKLPDFEDLRTAKESLEKLLNDIRNPHFETSNNDNFCENPFEAETFKTDSYHDPSRASSLNTYKKDIQNYTDNSVEENKSENECLNSSSEYIGIYQKALRKCNKKLTFDEGDNVGEKHHVAEKNTSSVSSLKENVEPSIIRIFTKFPEFEKKINNRNYSLNSDVVNAECNIDDYYSEDGEEHVMFENNCRDSNQETTEKIGNEIERDDPEKENICETDFNCFFKSIIKEIRETFAQVNTFCKNTDKELRNSENIFVRKDKIHKQAKEAYLCIEDLNKSLKDIIYRESCDNENCMKLQLSKAGIKLLNVDDKQFELYRDKISKFIEQANILQEAVNIIMSSVPV